MFRNAMRLLNVTRRVFEYLKRRESDIFWKDFFIGNESYSFPIIRVLYNQMISQKNSTTDRVHTYVNT